MNINATIVIQIINFFIVYGMLRVFLFKPGVKAINSEHTEIETMHGILSQQKKSIAIQERERQRYRYDCQAYFKSNSPDIFHQIMVVDIDNVAESSVDSVSLQQEDITLLAVDVRKKLEEKIKHVH